MADRKRWAILAVLCASLLLVAMDATILNVALPSLINDMRPSAIEQLWIIDIYGLILGGLLITMGAAGDRWGRRKMFLGGFALFGVASVIAATAQNPLTLICARVLLAVGGAMVMPSTLSMIRQIFSDARERSVAIGIWASVAGAGAAIGPVLGGLLIHKFSWHAAFWVNVPVVVVTLIAGLLILPESKHPSSTRLDWLSAFISIVGMIVAVWGIKKFSPLIFIAGVLLLWWFVRRQSKSADPLIDVKLFRNRTFVSAAIAILFAMMAIGAALFLISLWLQYVEEYNALQAGVRMLPAALALLAGSLSASRLVQRIGVRAVLGLGLGLLSLAFVALAVFPLHYPLVAVALVVFGLGDGLAITSSTAVMISAVPKARAGMAAASSETCYELGVGLGVALLGSVAGAAYRLGLGDLKLVEPNKSIVDESIGGAVEVASGLPGPVGQIVLDAAKMSYVDSLTLTSWVSAILVGLAALLTARLIPKGFRADGEH